MESQSIDWTVALPVAPVVDWATMEARARAEGLWDALMAVGAHASMAGADAALREYPLPEWAADFVRSQFPA